VWPLWPFTGQAHLEPCTTFCAVANSAVESDLAFLSQWPEVWWIAVAESPALSTMLAELGFARRFFRRFG
jgi:hypothetical protein